MQNILKILPISLKEEINKLDNIKEITEIRLRENKSTYIRWGKKEQEIKYIPDKIELINILRNISANSIYAIQQELNSGFVTIKGGHRVGITGEVVMDEVKVKNIKNISSINIRVAHEIRNTADKIINRVTKNDEFQNTLIISPPGCGKTTLLRDLIRYLSDLKYNIGVIDERGEIASVYEGRSYLDVGKRTDVISFCPKDIGINMLIRSMSPDIIATDEIGNEKDIEAIENAIRCGVKLLFTMHGETVTDVLKNEGIRNLLIEDKFKTVIVLTNDGNNVGHVKEICTDLGKVKWNKYIYEEEYKWS